MEQKSDKGTIQRRVQSPESTQLTKPKKRQQPRLIFFFPKKNKMFHLDDMLPEMLLAIARNLDAPNRARLRAVAKVFWVTDAGFRLPRPIEAAMRHYHGKRWKTAENVAAAIDQWLGLCDTPLFAMFDRCRFEVKIDNWKWELVANVHRGGCPEQFRLLLHIGLDGTSSICHYREGGSSELAPLRAMTSAPLVNILVSLRTWLEGEGIFSYLEEPTVIQRQGKGGLWFYVPSPPPPFMTVTDHHQ
jgi:hypothetical protein